jgi:hypothetical protein
MDSAARWLLLDQDVLGHMVTVLAATCGICPPAGQFKHICYDGSETQSRDVFVLSDGTVIFVNPSARPAASDSPPALFGLPPDARKSFLFYLTIIRPLACEILRLMRKDVPLYAAEIWAHTTRHPRNQNEWQWTGQDVVRFMSHRHLTLMGRPLLPSTIRTAVNSLLRNNFPGLFEAPFQSIVDHQAQHTTGTSIRNYGLLSYFPAFPHIKYELPLPALMMSQIWQWVLSIGPTNEAWHDMAMSSGLRPKHHFEDLAFEHARSAIWVHYGLPQYGNDLKVHVHTLLVEKPFLYGSQVCLHYILLNL